MYSISIEYLDMDLNFKIYVFNEYCLMENKMLILKPSSHNETVYLPFPSQARQIRELSSRTRKYAVLNSDRMLVK